MSETLHVAPDQPCLEHVACLELPRSVSIDVSRIVAPMPEALRNALGASIADMDPWRRYGFTPSVLARYFVPAEAHAPRFLLREGQRVAGMFALKLGWMFGSYLNILAVLPSHQGRGIGSAVLDWLEMRARANGERNQFVVTSAFNSGGLRLYERHGFRPIAEMPGLINAVETEILLRKRLASADGEPAG